LEEMMEIVAFESGLAEGVAGLYNGLIEAVPDVHPVPVKRFGSIEGLGSDRLREERLMVALEGGEVVGFVHVGVAKPDGHFPTPEGEPAAVRFLGYRRGQREAGRRLLEWVDEYAREQGRTEIKAWHYFATYPFYHCPWGQLSGKMGHVRALLGMYGYEDAGDSEMYFNWHDFEVPVVARPEIGFELKTEWREGGPMGERMVMAAVRGEERLGVCRMDHGQTSPNPKAKEWCYCDSLDVVDELQGKGLGKYVLASALEEMRRAGCRHASISTTWNNYRAALFYTNIGYRFADQTYSFRKGVGVG
jgi:GNAT superfamily N-acetyltransferase